MSTANRVRLTVRRGSPSRRAAGAWVVPPLVVLLAAFAPPATAAPGDLDVTFSDDGVAITGFEGHYGVAHGVAAYGSDRLVVVGSMHEDAGNGSDFALVRYTRTGRRDPTFGRSGRVLTDFGGRYDEAEAVAVGADGTMVAVGASTDDLAVARYRPDGGLDPSFADGGRLLLDLGAGDHGYDLAIQPDGRVLIAGTDGADFVLVRLNEDGSLDSSFGAGGIVRTDWAGFQDSARAVALQPDGRIVACGAAFMDATLDDFAVARYLPDGSLDPTFGNGGRVRTDFNKFWDRITDVVTQPDGAVLASGQVSTFPGSSDQKSDVGLARYLPDGRLDPSFGTEGKVHTDFGSDFDDAHGMALQADGRIVVASPRFLGHRYVAAVARYEPNGDLDPSFGTGGIAVTNIETSSDDVGGLSLYPNGRIAVVAGAVNASFDFAFLALRFLAA